MQSRSRSGNNRARLGSPSSGDWSGHGAIGAGTERRLFTTPGAASSSAAAEENVRLLLLSVSGSEQILVDPHNRDAVLRPRRGEALPADGQWSTAYNLEVLRTDGLEYSVPVRYSRFERLHAALLAELPKVRLPALPGKRGPLDLSRLLEAMSPRSPEPVFREPAAVEARTKALDAYVRELVELPGVASSTALLDLCALSSAADAALRTARSSAAPHELGRISRELATSAAYERMARSAKERAESRASAATASLAAACSLLARRRDGARLGRAWRGWQAQCRAAEAARRDKQEVASTAALSTQRALAASLGAQLEASESSLAEARAGFAAAADRSTGLERELEAALAAQADAAAAARAAAEAAASELAASQAQASAAAAAAAALSAQLRAAHEVAAAQRAEAAALVSALADADADAGGSAAASSSTHALLGDERRRRLVASLRSHLEQRAAEARLLALVQSQRAALAAGAAELAEARRAAAEASGKPALEAPWLAEVVEEEAEAEARGDESVDEAAAAEAAAAAAEEEDDRGGHDHEPGHRVDGWRREWLAAMAHSM